MRKVNSRITYAGIRPVILILVTAVYYYLANRIFGYVCPSEIFLGLPCPGCGLTKAALLLVKGDITGSLRMNPMLLFIPVYFILLICKKKKGADIYLIAIIILSLIVYCLRMAHSFGTEPLVYNPNSILSLILHFRSVIP